MPATQRDVRLFENQQPVQSASLGSTPVPTASGIGLGHQLPKLAVTSPSMDAAVTGILGQQRQLDEKLPGLQADVETRRQALGAELDKPLPSAPKLNPVPEFQPREVSGQEMNLFAGIAMALAGLGTVAMRGDMTMALNAAGNAMRGYNEGNLQQSRLDIENFRKKMESVIAENHRMADEYRGILENRRLSLQQKDQALRVAAASRDDQIMLSALQSGQFRTVFDLEAHRINATNQVALQTTQIYNSIINNMNKQEPLHPVQKPDGTVVYEPRSAAQGQRVPDSTTNRPPPAEVMRMNIAISAAGKALDNYEKLLKNFDPRSLDQMDPTQRAKMQSAISALQLEWKEAAALGALTGPDLEIMDKTLVNPASLSGAYYDRNGLLEQIKEARGYFGRRGEAIRQFYPGVGGQPSAPSAPPRLTEGQRDKSKSGRPIIVRNGRWEYE